MACEYKKTNHNSALCVLWNLFCFHFSKIPLFYKLTRNRPSEAKSVVPELCTRDSEHCWWFLLWQSFNWNLCGVINPWCNEFDIGNVKLFCILCHLISQHWNGQPVEIIPYGRKRPVCPTRTQGARDSVTMVLAWFCWKYSAFSNRGRDEPVIITSDNKLMLHKHQWWCIYLSDAIYL